MVDSEEVIQIDTKCFICGSEIKDNESIFVGNKDNHNVFTPESCSEFSMFHSECFKGENLNLEPEMIIPEETKEE